MNSMKYINMFDKNNWAHILGFRSYQLNNFTFFCPCHLRVLMKTPSERQLPLVYDCTGRATACYFEEHVIPGYKFCFFSWLIMQKVCFHLQIAL